MEFGNSLVLVCPDCGRRFVLRSGAVKIGPPAKAKPNCTSCAKATEFLDKYLEAHSTGQSSLLQVGKLLRAFGFILDAPPGEKKKGIASIRSSLVNVFRQKRRSDSTQLSIFVDADCDQYLLADFLCSLSELYTSVSGGDELVIADGQILLPEPEYEGVLE